MKWLVIFVLFGLMGCKNPNAGQNKQQDKTADVKVTKDTSGFHPEISMDSLNRLDDALKGEIAKKDKEIQNLDKK